MRSDMAKVIVERPRWAGRCLTFGERRHKFERASRDKTDPDVLPKTMPTRFERTKYLNENLQPLRRFLQSRIGRPWDAVYSELRARLAPRRTIDVHVLDHLDDFVDFTRREGGVLYAVDRSGRIAERIDQPVRYRRERFYVCCDTGILRPCPRVARKKKKKPR